MGKKSNTKKALREKLQDQDKKKKTLKKNAKRKLKKEIKKNIKKSPQKSQKAKAKEKTSKKTTIKLNKKLIGYILATISVVLLVLFAFFLFQKAFRAKPVAKLLPAEDTVALIEIMTNKEHSQYTKSFQLLKNNPLFSEQHFIDLIEEKFAINYEQEIRPWLGRQVAAALVVSTAEPKATNLIYFAEIKNKTALINLLKPHTQVEIYENQDIYILPYPSYLSIVDDYLVISAQKEAVQQIIDQNYKDVLYYSEKYRRIDDNLPLNRAMTLFLDLNHISPEVLSNMAFLSEKGISMDLLVPAMSLFDAEGIALMALDDHFALQSFLSLDREKLPGSRFLSFNEKYNADLAKYASPDTLAFWGGEDLSYQLQRIIEVISAGQQEKRTLLFNIFKNYAEKYFGEEIDFENDILVLFKKEFAIALEEIGDETAYKVLLELENPQNNALKLQEIANSFAETSAIFEPKVVEHTLEDGTKTKEIVAAPEEIVKNEKAYKDATIYELIVGKQEWGIYYAIVGDIAVIATHIDAVKSTIDTINGDAVGLDSTEVFAKDISPILKSSDQITYLNITKLAPLLFENKVPEILSAIESFSSGKNYFHDGITSISYLRMK